MRNVTGSCRVAWIVVVIGVAACQRGREKPREPPAEAPVAMAVDHDDARGKAQCNPDTGKMMTEVNELCAGDCIKQHEDTHVADRSACCAALARCIEKAKPKPAPKPKPKGEDGGDDDGGGGDDGGANGEATDDDDDGPEGALTRKQCVDKYNDWSRKTSDWTECNADTAEVACLEPVVESELEKDSGSVCSVEVESALKEARDRKTTHCKKAKELPCPL